MATPADTRRQFRPVRAGIEALLKAAPELQPRVEKVLWRGFYEVASVRGRGAGAALMNYGYASTEADGRLPGVDGEQDRFGRQLYAVVAGAADLEGLKVLEVGSGRGGGTAFVFEHAGPKSIVGLDLARTAVERARAQHGRPGLEFVAGDAEALPFGDQSFDAVLSVETSHCYGDVPRFLREVHRVLRPGGRLLLADFRYTAAPSANGDGATELSPDARFHDELIDAGFQITEEQDITPNVVRALALNTPAVLARIDRGVPKPLRRYAREFAAIEGSGVYRGLAEGALVYRRFSLQRD